jgi:hypothetical protein
MRASACEGSLIDHMAWFPASGRCDFNNDFVSGPVKAFPSQYRASKDYMQ